MTQQLLNLFHCRVISNSKIANLNDVYLGIMSREKETQQMVSLSGVTNLKMEMKHVAGFTEEPKLSPPPSRRKRRRMEQEVELEDEATREKGVFRIFQVEGTIGDAAYTTAVVVRRNVSSFLCFVLCFMT